VAAAAAAVGVVGLLAVEEAGVVAGGAAVAGGGGCGRWRLRKLRSGESSLANERGNTYFSFMPKAPQHKQKDLVGLSRKSIVNQLMAVKDSIVKKTPDYDMGGLVDQNKWQWFLKQLGHLGNKHYAYGSYGEPAVNNGVFRMGAAGAAPSGVDAPSGGTPSGGAAGAATRGCTVALLGDWASSTTESIQIGALVGEQDYSIHLGDTYYVGNSKEIADNFSHVDGAAWPYGRQGSFALLGNHEMYSSGKPFFTQLLPFMGSFVDGKVQRQQQASYFCLENDHWRIIGLDTGYDSLKGFFGLSANTGLTIPDGQMDWLRDVVRPASDKRGIILLSHHQCFSAFEKDEFQAIIPQIAPLLGGRDVLWFWGHEHRLSFYGYNSLGAPAGAVGASDGGKHAGAGGASGGGAVSGGGAAGSGLASDGGAAAGGGAGGAGCFARCIGHGGMPVEIGEFVLKGATATDKGNRNLVFYDKRVRETIDGNIALGHNGYVILEFLGQDLVIKYFDDAFVDAHGARSPIVEERWRVDRVTGVLTGRGIVDHTAGRAAAEDRLSFCQGIDTALAKFRREGS
jgi:Calcineurin-like phosphoesterase